MPSAAYRRNRQLLLDSACTSFGSRVCTYIWNDFIQNACEYRQKIRKNKFGSCSPRYSFFFLLSTQFFLALALLLCFCCYVHIFFSTAAFCFVLSFFPFFLGVKWLRRRARTMHKKRRKCFGF